MPREGLRRKCSGPLQHLGHSLRIRAANSEEESLRRGRKDGGNTRVLNSRSEVQDTRDSRNHGM